MNRVSSAYLARLQREVAPGETARFEINGVLIEFIPRQPMTRPAVAFMQRLRKSTLLFPILCAHSRS